MDKTPRKPQRSRSRKFQILALVLPLCLLVFSGLAVAMPLRVVFTPTSIYYLPVILMVPTPTHTITPTPTATPEATATLSPGSTSVSGTITGEEPTKPTYATYCEDVWFYEVIHNDDTVKPLRWGILGVGVVGPNTNVFHTSWSAPYEAYQMFVTNPNCYGPTGWPCSGTAAAGKHRDAIGGYRADSRLLYPGTYTLSMSLCLASYGACANGTGVWRVLSSVSIVAVDWYDPRCNRSAPPANAPAPTPDPLAGCRLDQSDPNRIHLVCPGR